MIIIAGRLAAQSRTGGVLGAVSSAAVIGACRIFYRVKFRDAKKLDDFFSRRPQNTGLHCNY